MILEELRKVRTLTSQEQVVADYILKDPEHILNLTTRQLAAETYVSAATVTRLCQRLGEKGFSNFKLRLIAELNAQKSDVYTNIAGPLMEYGLSAEQISERGLQFYRRVTYETKRKFTTDKMKKIRAMVQEAEVIEIYGTGINYGIAQNASFKFQSLGLRCQAYNELNVQNLANSNLSGKRRVSFLVSHTGANPAVLRIAKIFKQHKNPVIALCEDENSPLGKHADVHVGVINMGDLSMLSLLSYPLSCNYIFDMIYMSILTTNINKQFRMTARDFYADDSDRTEP